MDLQKELEAMDTKVDLSALEASFVKTAAKYAEAQGDLLRRVARARGVGRRAEEGRYFAGFVTRRQTLAAAAASNDSSSTIPSALPNSGSLHALGVGHQTDDVAGLVADAGDVVEAAVGVVDVADDDAVVVVQGAQRVGVAARSCPRSG